MSLFRQSKYDYWSESNISLKNKVEICFENWNKEKLSQIALLVLLVTTHVWSSRVFDKNYPSGLSLRFL